MRSHAGQGVGFQKIEAAVFVFQKIDPAPAASADGVEGAHGQFAHLFFVGLREVGRAEVNRVVAVVFRFLVVKLGGGDDAHRGQGFAAEDSAGVFAAADEFFGDDFAFVLPQFAVYVFQTAFFLDFHHADAAAFVGGFDKQRQAEFALHRVEVAVFAQHFVIGHGQAEPLP